MPVERAPQLTRIHTVANLNAACEAFETAVLVAAHRLVVLAARVHTLAELAARAQRRACRVILANNRRLG